MNLLNLFNPLQTAGMEEEFDAIKIGIASPETIARSNLSVTVYSVPKSLARSKTMNVCAVNTNA